MAGKLRARLVAIRLSKFARATRIARFSSSLCGGGFGGGDRSMPSEWPVNEVEDTAAPSPNGSSPTRRSRVPSVSFTSSPNDSSPVPASPSPAHTRPLSSLQPTLPALVELRRMEASLSAHPCPQCQHLSRRAQRKRGSRLGSSSQELATTRSPQLTELQIEDSVREESSKSSPSPAGSSSPVRRASWALRSVVAPDSAERQAAR